MFHERLKQIRKSRNVTQSQVSAMLEISTRNYQSFEYGECKPSFDTLIALAEYFDVSLDYLVGRIDENNYHEEVKKGECESTKEISGNNQILNYSHLKLLEKLLNSMKYGNVVLVVQDEKIVQIEKTEKHRLKD